MSLAVLAKIIKPALQCTSWKMENGVTQASQSQCPPTQAMHLGDIRRFDLRQLSLDTSCSARRIL